MGAFAGPLQALNFREAGSRQSLGELVNGPAIRGHDLVVGGGDLVTSGLPFSGDGHCGHAQGVEVVIDGCHKPAGDPAYRITSREPHPPEPLDTNLDAGKRIGLRCSRRLPAGSRPCRLTLPNYFRIERMYFAVPGFFSKLLVVMQYSAHSWAGPQ